MKLLFIDIETAPAVVMVWSLFNQNVSIDQIMEPTSVLCFAAKWADDKEVKFYKGQPGTASHLNMIQKAHELLSQATAVCHFNGASFDIPRLNTEFIKYDLSPPPPTHQIDLKKVVMSKFDMTSSKLAFVGPFLKIGAKVKNEGWPLWRGCLDNDQAAWGRMKTYNKQDVVLLEKLYNRVLPWIDGHPNLNTIDESGEVRCPSCKSELVIKSGWRTTATTRYRRYQCKACGHWSRSRTAEKGASRPALV